MVVAAGAEERGLVAELRRQPEAEHVAVEADVSVDVGDAEMDVAHRRPVGEPVEGLAGSSSSREQVVDVERRVVIRSATWPSHSSRGRSA